MDIGEFVCWLLLGICILLLLIVAFIWIVRLILKWSARQVIDEVNKSKTKMQGEKK